MTKCLRPQGRFEKIECINDALRNPRYRDESALCPRKCRYNLYQ